MICCLVGGDRAASGDTAPTSVPCGCGIVGGLEGWHSILVKVAAGHWSSSCRLGSQEVVDGPKKEGCVIDSAGGCCKLFRGGAAGRSWEPSGSSGRSVSMCLLYWVLQAFLWREISAYTIN